MVSNILQLILNFISIYWFIYDDFKFLTILQQIPILTYIDLNIWVHNHYFIGISQFIT
jgi:hypothetical protein